MHSSSSSNKGKRVQACFLVMLLVFAILFILARKQSVYTESLCSSMSIHGLLDTQAHGSVHYVAQNCPTRLFESNEHGRTALAHAIVIDSQSIANYLYSYGAHAKLLDNCGESYLHLAACVGNVELATSLVDQYEYSILDVSLCTNYTAIDCARANGHAAVISELERRLRLGE